MLSLLSEPDSTTELPERLTVRSSLLRLCALRLLSQSRTDHLIFQISAFAPAARAASLAGTGGIIHFEIMPKNINKVVQATIPVLGDVVASLEALVPKIQTTARADWLAQIKGWKDKYPFTFEPSKEGEKLKPQEVIVELDRAADRMGSASPLRHPPLL